MFSILTSNYCSSVSTSKIQLNDKNIAVSRSFRLITVFWILTYIRYCRTMCEDKYTKYIFRLSLLRAIEILQEDKYVDNVFQTCFQKYAAEDFWYHQTSVLHTSSTWLWAKNNNDKVLNNLSANIALKYWHYTTYISPAFFCVTDLYQIVGHLVWKLLCACKQVHVSFTTCLMFLTISTISTSAPNGGYYHNWLPISDVKLQEWF